MKFYKDTKSFKLITLLEKMVIKHKVLNLLLVETKLTIKLVIFTNMNRIKIKMRKTNKDKLNLFLELYKEYFYLWNIHNEAGLEKIDSLSYCIINNSLISDTTISNVLHIHMEINLLNDMWNGNIKCNDMQINITEKSLENDNIYNAFNKLLLVINANIGIYMSKLIMYYKKRCYNV